MDPEFWQQRWARDEIGFHRSDIHPMLERHWPAIAPACDLPVLAPLCGKSRDLDWLAERGHPVVGVELSGVAVDAWFRERGLVPERTVVGGLEARCCGPVTLCIGDFFEFAPGARFPYLFDRAAMVALPPARRDAYRAALARLLAQDGRGLLITLEYEQSAMDGPPFSVDGTELERDPVLAYRSLEAIDALPTHPGFRQRGLRALTERASVVRHRAAVPG